MDEASIKKCYQCGISISGNPIVFNVKGVDREFCCTGCYLVNKISGNETSQSVQKFFIKFGISFFLAGYVMMLSFTIYGGDVSKTSHDPIVRLTNYFLLLLSTPVMALIGFDYLVNSIKALLRKSITTDLLIAIGAFSAYGISIYSTLMGVGTPYYETATMIVALSAFGKFIEAFGRYRAAKSIGETKDLLPNYATVVENNSEKIVRIDEVKIGDVVKVKPDEIIPVDGVVVEGEGFVKESFFTGEQKPVAKFEGDSVYAGSVSIDGSFLIKAINDFNSNTINKIIENIEIAKISFAPEKNIADKISAIFVPTIITLSLITFGFWYYKSGFDKALMSSLAVLLIACPCAFNVAAPLALWNAANSLARRGIILQNLRALYSVRYINEVLFDKTGTITLENLEYSGYNQFGDEKDFIKKVASIENYSKHPIAKSLLNYYQGDFLKPSKVRIIPGYGIEAFIENKKWHIGSKELMESMGITPKACGENLSCVYVAVDGKLEGILYFKQKIDENALEAIKRLKHMGYKVGLISGDERAFVEELSDIFDELYWSLKPQDKQRVVMDKKAKGSKIMYIGDGINDALAMAVSDVSIAVANASGVARISAGILLFNRNLKAIPWIIKFSNNVKKIIYTNFIWASVYNTFGIALAMAGLIQPIWSAVFMIISSVSVVYNSSRIENM